MSVLAVGLSHNSAPVPVLERAAVSGDTLAKLLLDLAARRTAHRRGCHPRPHLHGRSLPCLTVTRCSGRDGQRS